MLRINANEPFGHPNVIVVVISNWGRSNSNGESETIILSAILGGKGKRKVRYAAQSLRSQISKI